MSEEKRDLDERGYPPGYVPGRWKCPECGSRFDDSEEAGNPHISWELDPECGYCGGVVMERIGDLEDPAPDEEKPLDEGAVIRRILAAGQALVEKNPDEAYHHLYCTLVCDFGYSEVPGGPFDAARKSLPHLQSTPASGEGEPVSPMQESLERAATAVDEYARRTLHKTAAIMDDPPTEDEIEALLDWAEAGGEDKWLPTSENINALPKGLRDWIHDLETRADPAEDVRARIMAEDTIRHLLAHPQPTGEPDAWISKADLALVRSKVPGVPKVNLWAEGDEGDTPVYFGSPPTGEPYPPTDPGESGEHGIRTKTNGEVAKWLDSLADLADNPTDRVVLDEAASRLRRTREPEPVAYRVDDEHGETWWYRPDWASAMSEAVNIGGTFVALYTHPPAEGDEE